MDLLRPLRIGSATLPNNVMLSPMAGFTDQPFRALCRQHGAGLVSTEMVAAVALDHDAKRARLRAATTPEERPVSIQLVGNDPEAVARAARTAGEQCEVLGLNFGCPAHQVARTGCGAALLDQPDLAVRLVEAIKDASPRPLLVKMRAGTRAVMDVEGFARRLEDAGADALLFHARTAAQGYSGLADWGLVKRVKGAVSIPVVGNGDVRTGPDAERGLRASGCDGIAVGRASLGDPRVFARIAAHLQGLPPPPMPGPAERLADVRAYVQGAAALGLGWGHVGPQIQAFTKGMEGGSALRPLLSRTRDPARALARFEEHVARLAPVPLAAAAQA